MVKERTLCIDLRWIDSSGVGVYVQGILPGVIQQLRDVSIVGVGDVSRLQQFSWSGARNVRLIDCRAPRYSLAEQLQLIQAIPRATSLYFSPYYTIPLLYRGPIAVTVHDLSHLVVPEIRGNRMKHLYARAMYRTLRKRASVIFTVSNFTKSELLRLTSGPREDNIIPTYLGISPQWFEASTTQPVRSRPYFLHVGNVKPYKNIGRLVEAFLAIQDRVPHDLVIVGQSEGLITGESPSFFERVKAAGDRVHMTGFVSHQDLFSLVGHAQALVMPSLYEGFGLPPLEAMAAGVPVTVSRTASLPEVCGDAALYFDPMSVDDIAAKLLELANSCELRSRLVAAGLQRSRSFNWETCASTTAAGLRTAMEAA